jgi:hypothetical protein
MTYIRFKEYYRNQIINLMVPNRIHLQNITNLYHIYVLYIVLYPGIDWPCTLNRLIYLSCV